MCTVIKRSLTRTESKSMADHLNPWLCIEVDPCMWEEEWRGWEERLKGGEGRGGEEQRAGLVGDQMSSQWGRNDEVRMQGRREV